MVLGGNVCFLTQPAKSLKSNTGGVFVESAFNMRCHIVKNALLHIVFSAILPAGMYLIVKKYEGVFTYLHIIKHLPRRTFLPIRFLFVQVTPLHGALASSASCVLNTLLMALACYLHPVALITWLITEAEAAVPKTFKCQSCEKVCNTKQGLIRHNKKFHQWISKFAFHRQEKNRNTQKHICLFYSVVKSVKKIQHQMLMRNGWRL